MRVEERWENQGRDRITLQEVLELHCRWAYRIGCHANLVRGNHEIQR